MKTSRIRIEEINIPAEPDRITDLWLVNDALGEDEVFATSFRDASHAEKVVLMRFETVQYFARMFNG